MKIIYKGKFEGEIEEFPNNKNVKGAVQYKEVDTVEELGKVVAIPANILQFILLVVTVLIMGWNIFIKEIDVLIIAFLVSLILMVPHELLHGICFKKDVYLYTNLKQLMLFVVGEDHLSKNMFIFMSLLPNIVLGLIPYIIFLFNTDLIFLGFLGAINLSYGCGDYYNVWNTIRQVPKNGKVFGLGHHSYWYVPKENKNEK